MDTLVKPRHPQVDGASLVAQARDMVPYLREMANVTNTLRRPPDEVRQRLKEAGFARLWQPKRYGGAEGDLTTGPTSCARSAAAAARPRGSWRRTSSTT